MSNRFWLMWGWIDPERRLAPRLVVRRPGAYSETNYNLLLDRLPELETRLSDFELGQFVTALGDGLSGGTARLLEEGCWSPLCEKCRKDSSSPCQLFVKPWPLGWTREVPFPGGVRTLLQKSPGPCLILAKLAGMTETRWERRFFELYFAYGFQGARRRAGEVLEGAVADPSSAGLPADVGSEEWARALWRDLMATLTVPALLPQAVLNLARTADLPPDHPELDFFEDNVARVDFVFVHNGERHIVEIDGLHRVSEKGYTRNLRVERVLRDQGWHLHCFGELEMKEAGDFQEFAWELGFPSRLYAWMRNSSNAARGGCV